MMVVDNGTDQLNVIERRFMLCFVLLKHGKILMAVVNPVLYDRYWLHKGLSLHNTVCQMDDLLRLIGLWDVIKKNRD